MAAREHYSAYAASEVTTTSSSTWTNAATLNFTPASGRDYVLLWSLEVAQQSSTSSDAKFRVSLDGAPVATANVESRITSEYPSYSGFFKIAGAGAAKAVTVEIQSETSGQTTAARNIRLIALALGANDKYVETLGRQDVTNVAFVDLVSTTFTPPSTGDYLCLSSVLVDNYAATNPGYGRFDVGSTSSEFMGAVADTTNLTPLNGVWVVNLTASSKTLKWQGRSHASGNSSGWTDTRLLALRLDDFDNAASNSLGSDDASSSTTPSTVLTLTASANANPHLVLGYWAIGASVSTTLGYVEAEDALGSISDSARRALGVSSARGAGSSFVALRTGYSAGSQSWTLTRTADGTNAYTVKAGAILVALDLGAAGQTLSAAAGAVALTGLAAATRATRNLPAAARSFTLAGINAAIRKGYRVRADVRGYGLTGISARVARGLKLRVSAQAFTMTGIAAGLIRTVAGRTISAVTGALTLTRQPAGLRIGRKLRAAPEPFVWSRLAAGLRWTRQLAASGAFFSLSGRQIGWGWVHILRGAPAAYSLNGQAATLRYSGGQGWQPVPGTPETWSPKPGKGETWTPVGDTPEIWS